MKKFCVYWLDGKSEMVEGFDISDACNRAGIGNGALSAMDYWEEITNNNETKNEE